MAEKEFDVSGLFEDYSDAKLDAKKALGIFAACYIGHQIIFLVSSLFLIPLFTHLYFIKYGNIDIAHAKEIIKPQVSIVSTFIGDIADAVILILLSIKLAKPNLQKRRIVDAAWVTGKPSDLFTGVICGFFAYLFLVFTNIFLQLCFGTTATSYINDQANLHQNVGTAFILITNALRFILAAPIEELLCRGIVFGGFTKSWGVFAASCVSTGLFIILHLPIMNFIDLTTLITLSIIAIFLRVRKKAIGPAISFHLSYNLIILLMLAKELFKF